MKDRCSQTQTQKLELPVIELGKTPTQMLHECCGWHSWKGYHPCVSCDLPARFSSFIRTSEHVRLRNWWQGVCRPSAQDTTMLLNELKVNRFSQCNAYLSVSGRYPLPARNTTWRYQCPALRPCRLIFRPWLWRRSSVNVSVSWGLIFEALAPPQNTS